VDGSWALFVEEEEEPGIEPLRGEYRFFSLS